jgi:hypothetical protein
MSQPWYDPTSKWLLEEQGASILYLAGARSVVSCKARKAEVVQPRKLPDGLLEVVFAGEKEPQLMLVEVATYPEERVVEQISDDIRLVRQARKVLPEALVLCLCPKGTYRVPQRVEAKSRLGWTAEVLSWKVIEMWTQSAETVLEAPGVGTVPLATLAHFDGPPEMLLQRCRDRIDREGGEQRANLLAVTQVFAHLHFNKPHWLDILGGTKAMIESPLIQGIVAESSQAAQVKFMIHQLKGRFGPVGPNITAGLAQIKSEEKLLRLGLHVTTCKSLEAFEDRLREELPQPAPPSTRGKRRPKKPAE